VSGLLIGTGDDLPPVVSLSSICPGIQNITYDNLGILVLELFGTNALQEGTLNVQVRYIKPNF